MLERLNTDYIDLLYVHQPIGDFVADWKDMEYPGEPLGDGAPALTFFVGKGIIWGIYFFYLSLYNLWCRQQFHG